MASTTTVPDDVVVVQRPAVLRLALSAVVVLNIANAVNIAFVFEKKWLFLAFERNPSTWFAAALLASAAAMAWVVGRSGQALEWNLVAAVFALMSLDEVATFHEKLGGLPGLPAVGNRGWVAGGLLLAAVVAWRLLPWVLTLPPSLRTAIIGGATVFLVGAVGGEELAARWAFDHGEDRTFFLISSIEENLEMLGVLWVLTRLLDHARDIGATLRLRFV